MEQLNSNLYAKYTNLKKSKSLVDEEGIHSVDLTNLQSAMEAVEDLANANYQLRTELDSLQKQYADCRELMLQECRKTEELSDEVGRLQDQLSKRSTDTQSAVRRSPRTSPIGTRSKSKGSASKLAPYSVTRQIEVQDKEPVSVAKESCQTKVVVVFSQIAVEEAPLFQLDGQSKMTFSAETPGINPVSEATKTKANTNTYREATGEAEGRCVFKTLFELLLGMQFSVDSHSGGPCISAVHQRSGYTFTLAWLRREDGDDEFMYHASSFGTLERIALEWMKEDIIFSKDMWPVFFERMSQVIGHS